ncbi:EAL and HDOD domain-containing protein [Cytobacillus sp. FJAT-54145]|uniref:EAL and HDOD domain-containing protein n=1 Tax=Cytobacillus spartinae TaxID=3299023 RepID=A0ABW6KCW1_9BACI
MEVYVARQPIFNISEEVFGYELLYRSNEENSFPNINGDQATADVIINSFLNIGIDELSNGKPCFINFTANLLQLRLPTYFRPREIIVEILESVEPNQELIEICKELKQLGYQIALDDFVFNDQNPYSYQLIKYADIIKVDFLHTPREMRETVETFAKTLKLKMVAEKVETREAFEEAKERGYHYFQGYFFAKPTVVSTHDVPTYFQSYFDIIHNLSMTEPSIDIISELIERDVSLSYKLLKLINSPAFRPKHKINSIRQAIVLLGLIEIQKWIYVLAVRENTTDKKELVKETINLCLTRAKMCESVQKLRKKTAVTAGYFMTGMFSLMDSIIGVPMEKLLQDLPLQDEIVEALKGNSNQFREVLDLVIAVERAEWCVISEKCQTLQIEEKDLFLLYADSISWTRDLILSEVTS